MTKTELDLTQIDGVKVAQRETAKMTHGDNVGSLLPDVDEVLLADGRVLYQCVARTGGCGKTWDNPRSVIAHLRNHQGIVAQRRIQQELEEVTRRNQQLEKQARENDRRRQKRDVEKTTASTPTPVIDKNIDDRRRQALALIDDGMNMMQKGYELVEQGAQRLFDMTQLINPKITAKAERWDEMQRLLGNTTGK